MFAVFYGLDWIAVMPPIFALVNEVFGRKSAPVLMSWIFATHQIGGATAAVGAGIVRTVDRQLSAGVHGEWAGVPARVDAGLADRPRSAGDGRG